MDVTSESAGIYAENGASASKNAILAMKGYGIDISKHKARQITEDIINDSDLILTMTEGHKMMLLGMAPDNIYTIAEFVGFGGDISDPFGGSLNDYKACAEEIYDYLTDVAEKIYDIYEK